MLTRELAIAEYDFERGRVVPDRLTQRSHRRYLAYAQRMLAVYRGGIGRARGELHRSVRSIFDGEEDCPSRRIDAFCKLLDDASTFARDLRGKAAALRREVFRRAAHKHPLVQQRDRLYEHDEQEVKAEIAQALGRSWDEIDAELFADVIEFHRLREFAGYPTPAALLARYNVAQVQAALFDAVTMTVKAGADFKTILRYAKLARLMHTIVRLPDGGYQLRFDGPASVLRQTRRYGAAMARFLPALIACGDWQMQAVVQTRRSAWQLALDLTSDDGLSSHLPPPQDFDSDVEQTFAEKWGDQPRDGWQLIREGDILHRGQSVFVPDFVFEHGDGRRVLFEIVGFWTPEYLQAKAKTLEKFADERIVLAVSETAGKQVPELASGAIVFKSAPAIKDVLGRLKREEAH